MGRARQGSFAFINALASGLCGHSAGNYAAIVPVCFVSLSEDESVESAAP